MARDIENSVQNDLAEQLSGKSGSADDLRHEIENAEHSFDFDSYAPYTSQEIEVISDLESDYWRDAEEIIGEQTFRVTEWEQARRTYAGALAYTAYSAKWEEAKQELIETIEQFESDTINAGCEEPVISLSTSCLHGWAAHDREDESGNLIWESGQLDGCNGLAREVSGLWLSVCFDPHVADDHERSYGLRK